MKRPPHPPPTPSQTIGPFFPPHLVPPGANDLTVRAAGAPPASGQSVLLAGRLVGEGGKPAVNALIEIWQADANGRFDHPADRRNTPVDRNFAFWGRARTDGRGHYEFRTIKPGSVDRKSAPHISMTILGSGLMRRLVTRMYFPGETLNASDPLLLSLTAAQRRRLIARPAAGSESPLPSGERKGEGEPPIARKPAGRQRDSGNSPSPLLSDRRRASPRGGEGEVLALVFDIVLRGKSETPFLED